MTLRSRLHRQLDPRAWPCDGLSPTNRCVTIAIGVAVAAAILETETALAVRYATGFRLLELGLGIAFTLEFAARLWSVAELGGSATRARFAFLVSPAGLIDLLVLVVTLLPALGVSALPLRLIRVLRILSLAKLGRMSVAMGHIVRAVASRRDELLLTVGLAVTILIAGATLLYLLEGAAQPATFGSIPRALWWAVVTLTTIGYGDVYPVTVPGKLAASLVAFAGIGLIALPTGILASAFSEAHRAVKSPSEKRERG